jgi:hypothetical protein
MCNSCVALRINGVYCHESGCPDSHLDANGKPKEVECKWCGSMFVPEDRHQLFCEDSCAEAYYG